MAKNAVYRPDQTVLFENDLLVKKLALFFDKIYISNLAIFYRHEDPYWKQFKGNDIIYEAVKRNNELIDYLTEKNIAVPYLHSFDINADSVLNDRNMKYYKSALAAIEEQTAITDKIDEYKTNVDFDLAYQRVQDLSIRTSDNSARFDAVNFSSKDNSEFYPILLSDVSYESKEKKSEVISFVLDRIPTPDHTTSWEQIIEFRSDEVVYNKYLALINWINEIARTEFSFNEIKEKYDYLYSEYIRHYKLHKIKSNYSVLEVLVPGAASLLLGEPFSGLKLASDYIKIKLKSVSLLEDEAKLPGKEIAYIYKTNETFKKS